jgi:hypothetical protein
VRVAGGDDQGPLGAPRAQEVVRDEARLDGLPEPDLVGEEPAHRVLTRRLERDVELVGEEPDPPPEERRQVVGLPAAREVVGVEAQGEVLDRVHLARDEALERIVAGDRDLPLARGAERVGCRPEAEGRVGVGEEDDDRAAVGLDDAADTEVGVLAVRDAVVDRPHRKGRLESGGW